MNEMSEEKNHDELSAAQVRGRGGEGGATVAEKHVHKWQPCGTAVENHQFFDGITNPWARITLAIRSCECGAIRRTEVGRVYLRR